MKYIRQLAARAVAALIRGVRRFYRRAEIYHALVCKAVETLGAKYPRCTACGGGKRVDVWRVHAADERTLRLIVECHGTTRVRDIEAFELARHKTLFAMADALRQDPFPEVVA